MNNQKYGFFPTHMENEQNYVKEAFDTNWVATLGPNVNGLEQDLNFI
jgi:dTDP-4-amino-4,6-dideoxygalactose transaminase